MNALMELPRHFELPDEVAEWDDKSFFTYLQEHQFAYLARLEELKANGAADTDEYRHWLRQFETVEHYLAGDFNRRYFQG